MFPGSQESRQQRNRRGLGIGAVVVGAVIAGGSLLGINPNPSKTRTPGVAAAEAVATGVEQVQASNQRIVLFEGVNLRRTPAIPQEQSDGSNLLMKVGKDPLVLTGRGLVDDISSEKTWLIGYIKTDKGGNSVQPFYVDWTDIQAEQKAGKGHFYEQLAPKTGVETFEPILVGDLYVDPSTHEPIGIASIVPQKVLGQYSETAGLIRVG